MTEKTPQLILAPIRGITDCHFRSLFQRHFPGFDSALAPFVNPQRHSNFQPKQLKDLLPEENREMVVVPQFLHTDPDDFLILAGRLLDLGYTQVNWNLGCPAHMVTRKKRGSGLLPHPDLILAFLDQVMPRLPMKLSIKTRLGLEEKEELLHLLPRLDDYPLEEIIIHGRLGRQMYRGEADREAFALCLEQSRHPIVYNGDINSVLIFQELQEQFPTIDRWMIGRGALANPFLPGEIKGLEVPDRLERLERFHRELYHCYQEMLSGPTHLLGRMKQLWIYLSASFPPQQKTWKKIKKCHTEVQYQQVIESLFSAKK